MSGDLGPILRKNMEKTEEWFFDYNSFLLGFRKKLVYIKYQDVPVSNGDLFQIFTCIRQLILGLEFE